MEQFYKEREGDPKGSGLLYNKCHGNNYDHDKGRGNALYWEDLVNGNDRRPDVSDRGVIQQFQLKNGSVIKYRVIGTGISGGPAMSVITVAPYTGSRGIKSK